MIVKGNNRDIRIDSRKAFPSRTKNDYNMRFYVNIFRDKVLLILDAGVIVKIPTFDSPLDEGGLNS